MKAKHATHVPVEMILYLSTIGAILGAVVRTVRGTMTPLHWEVIVGLVMV